MNIVVLAAGIGKRMNSDLPKVLHPLAGRPLLAHVMETLAQLNLPNAHIHLVASPKNIDALRHAFPQTNINWIVQAVQLGTGHAVQQALPHLENSARTLVLYGDVPLLTHTTLASFLSQKESLVILTAQLDDPSGYGRIVREGEKIIRVAEEKDATSSERCINEVNSGVMAMNTEALARWLPKLKSDNKGREFYLTDIVALAIAEELTVGACQAQPWEIVGINTCAQLAAAERRYQARLAQALMDAGVILMDPHRLDVRGHLVCGKDVKIDVNCVFSGEVVVEDGVHIGANCVIENSHIGRGSNIAAFSWMSQARVGMRCHVGPYARLRPGTQLDDGVHIGNFVEIKNSRIGQDSKANHLTYLGDADVGKKVNIGAGSITCNYDGANKYRTTIDDHAFVGSGSQLVAPVTVGEGATLGAGTVLTKSAPAGALVLTRAQQMTHKNWSRPKKK